MDSTEIITVNGCNYLGEKNVCTTLNKMVAVGISDFYNAMLKTITYSFLKIPDVMLHTLTA